MFAPPSILCFLTVLLFVLFALLIITILQDSDIVKNRARAHSADSTIFYAQATPFSIVHLPTTVSYRKHSGGAKFVAKEPFEEIQPENNNFDQKNAPTQSCATVNRTKCPEKKIHIEDLTTTKMGIKLIKNINKSIRKGDYFVNFCVYRKYTDFSSVVRRKFTVSKRFLPTKLPPIYQNIAY